jgi:hypothetical protein
VDEWIRHVPDLQQGGAMTYAPPRLIQSAETTVIVSGAMPNYALPESLTALRIEGTGPANSTNSIKPAMASSANWNYALINNFGGGCLVEGYSNAGAYVIAGSGGHTIPGINTGAAVFDFQTGLWERLDTTPDVRNYTRDFSYNTETTLQPYEEVLLPGGASSGVPTPTHLYLLCEQIPAGTAFPRGGVLLYSRASTTDLGSGARGSHTFNLATGLWARANDAGGFEQYYVETEGACVWDAGRNKYWYFRSTQNSYSSLRYLNGGTFTPGSLSHNGSGIQGQSAMMYQGYIIRPQSVYGASPTAWFIFDPDAPSVGWTALTFDTALPTVHRCNQWAYFPPNGCFYYYGHNATDNVLFRVTPPVSNPRTGTWTVDSVAVGGDQLPARQSMGEGTVWHHSRGLVYVPALQRLAWFPGGTEGVYLINPGSWDVGSRTFAQGVSSPANIASTVPADMTTGGIYGVEPTTALPSGMTLTDAGVLDVGTATVSSASVVFTYHEPGGLSTLTLHGTGTNVPYMATVYPLEGAVPSGQILGSPDDPTLRSSVLSTWPDGSASVVVLAGQTTVSGTKSVRLRPTVSSDPALTTAAITSKFTTGITVNFGAGDQTLNTWTSPDWIWWSNSQVICARYRMSITGMGSMEAVIDVHAFAGGRAFVEVVIENSSLDPATAIASNTATWPIAQTYTGATVKVNGATIGTANSSDSPSGTTHQAFRGWYCSGWVGGDPSIEVTHDTASMQQHPLFYKIEKASTVDLTATYGSDAYTPWYWGRYSHSMAGTGDVPHIGPLPRWEAQYLQSGDRSARKAVIASVLGLLTWNLHYRHVTKSRPLEFADTYGKNFAGGTFPRTASSPFGIYTDTDAHWDALHQPAAGLMAFLCRPSPCFIEMAQKIAAFNALSDDKNTQIFGEYFNGRGRAWAFRNLAHAVFLTPTMGGAGTAFSTWRTGAVSNLASNVTYLLRWPQNTAEDKLNIMWDYSPDPSVPRGQSTYRDASGADGVNMQSVWYHHFAAVEVHKTREAKILSGSAQTDIGTLADWFLLQAPRWINEQPGGGWRYIAIGTVTGSVDGSNSTGMGQPATWGQARALRFTGDPPTVAGPFYTRDQSDPTPWTNPAWTLETYTAVGYQYTKPFWSALVAAVERGTPGAEAAWATINDATNGLTTIAAFRNYAQIDPRHNSWPRNK